MFQDVMNLPDSRMWEAELRGETHAVSIHSFWLWAAIHWAGNLQNFTFNQFIYFKDATTVQTSTSKVLL